MRGKEERIRRDKPLVFRDQRMLGGNTAVERSGRHLFKPFQWEESVSLFSEVPGRAALFPSPDLEVTLHLSYAFGPGLCRNGQ